MVQGQYHGFYWSDAMIKEKKAGEETEKPTKAQ